MTQLMCMGLATLDTIVALPRWPDPDDRLVVQPVLSAGGGPAATAAVTAARLGRSVGIVGCVGRDAAGASVREGLVEWGVDVTHLSDQPGRTAQSVILVDQEAATRTILHAPGVERAGLDPAARAACEAAAWVHVDHAGWPWALALERSRLSVDAGNPVAGLDLAELGLYAPTAAALRARYPGLSMGDCVRRALDEGAERVVVTLGAGGALGADRGGAWRVEAAPVEVVSTLGAGDVFHGAILAALIEGRPLPDAMRIANLAAALSCRGIDGRSAIPAPSELEARLESAPEPQPVVLGGDA